MLFTEDSLPSYNNITSGRPPAGFEIKHTHTHTHILTFSLLFTLVKDLLVAERGCGQSTDHNHPSTQSAVVRQPIGKTRPVIQSAVVCQPIGKNRPVIRSAVVVHRTTKRTNFVHSANRNLRPNPAAKRNFAFLQRANPAKLHAKPVVNPFGGAKPSATSNHTTTLVNSKPRTEPTTDTDDDIVNIKESIELPALPSRGQLLRLSTLKPKPVGAQAIQEPDEIPPNSLSIVKRVVRLQLPPPEKGTAKSIQTQTPALIKPQTASIGIQVGESAFGRPTKSEQYNELPLKSFYTHKINLPFPPAQNYNQQQQVSQSILRAYSEQQQQQQIQQHFQTFLSQIQSFATPNQIQPNFAALATPSTRPFQGPLRTERRYNHQNRRNFAKRQKWLAKKNKQE